MSKELFSKGNITMDFFPPSPENPMKLDIWDWWWEGQSQNVEVKLILTGLLSPSAQRIETMRKAKATNTKDEA